MPAFETQTNIITAVALHLTAESAVPTLPSPGASIDWTASPGGWEKFDFKFAEDAFATSKNDQKRIVIQPPGVPNKTRVIELPETVDSAEFTAYEIGGIVFGYATNYTESNGVFTPNTDGHTAYRSLIIEYGGIGLQYFPKVTISVDWPTGGVWEPGKQKGRFEVFGTSTIPSGAQWHQYQ
ncbi:MAG: hypothetical protein KJ050_10640 [Candidatus Omnitrophica bacterium]|nr:hypothetical protein [Candidatus Omnitrophota bacterium]